MTTRAALRKSLGVRMQQPFFRRFGTGELKASTTGTTTTLIDTARLKEVDNFWRGNFIYFPGTDELREISAFTNSSSTVTWLAPIAAAPTSATAYEIWSQLTPHEVHEAINRAIRNAWPDFFQSGTDETLIVNDENGTVYTLPTTMRRVLEVYITVYNGTTGTVTSTGANTVLIDSGASFTSADVGKYISIYADDDSCVGNYRQISAVDSGTQVTVGTAFTAALDIGAKYRMLDTNDVYSRHGPLSNWLLNSDDYPTEIWFGAHMAGYEGYPIKFVYEYEYTVLTTEAGTTALPDEYIYNEALHYLYSLKLASAPASEVPNWEAMQKMYAKYVEEYRKQRKQRHKPSSMNRFQSGWSVDSPFRR